MEIDIEFSGNISKRGKDLMIHIPRNFRDVIEIERLDNPTVNVRLYFPYKKREEVK